MNNQLIRLRDKLALLGEKLGMDRRSEVKLMKGIMNNGELATEVGRVNGFERGWLEAEEKTTVLRRMDDQSKEEQTHLAMEGS